MKFALANPQTPLDHYLMKVEQTESPGLITAAHEWIADGWGLDGIPEAEQLAAAMFLEAKTQDGCVERGESSEEYPKQLRTIAHEIHFCCRY